MRQHLFVFILTSLLFCRVSAANEAPPVPVEITQVKQAELANGVVATGELKAKQSVSIKSEISGKISHMHLPEGKVVEKNVVLIELDSAIPKATLSQAIAKHENSLQQYKRLETLAGKGLSSPSDKGTALATLRSDEATVQLAKAELEKSKIKAPFTGMLGLRQVDIGDYINPGQWLINLDDISALLVDFRIPEKYFPQLKEEQAIEVTLEAFPGQAFEGKIYAISPQIDPTTRTIQARAILPNGNQLLRPGLFAKVKVIFSRNKQALVVPEQAVFNMQDKSYVYRIQNHKAILTEVKTGIRENGQVEILSGLTVNEMITKSRHLKLFNGATVFEAKNPMQGENSK